MLDYDGIIVQDDDGNKMTLREYSLMMYEASRAEWDESPDSD